jgi:Flp pilus assembly protein TadG
MRGQGLIKRRGGKKSGATALEFALIAPIFFTLMFAIIETGAVYIGEAWLQYATSDVGRRVRTGEVQIANTTETQFRAMICARLSPFLACDQNLQIDVNAYNDFSAADMSPPLDANGNFDPNKVHYDPGDPCEVVIVRTFYKWTLNTPVLSAFLVNNGTNKHLLASAAAMRNEPYTSAVAGC